MLAAAGRSLNNILIMCLHRLALGVFPIFDLCRLRFLRTAFRLQCIAPRAVLGYMLQHLKARYVVLIVNTHKTNEIRYNAADHVDALSDLSIHGQPSG